MLNRTLSDLAHITDLNKMVNHRMSVKYGLERTSKLKKMKAIWHNRICHYTGQLNLSSYKSKRKTQILMLVS